MAKIKTNNCVSCGLPCLGDSCPNMNVVSFTCDECGKEYDPDELYMYDDEMLCDKCLLNRFETAKQVGFDYDDE